MPAGLLCLLFLAASTAGCGGGDKSTLPPPPSPVENPADIVWNQEKDGIRFRIEASSDLNREKDTALGLTICVYQLKDCSAFSALAASPRGIDTLLDGDLQKADALSSRVYHIQPGSTLDVAADRMEGARYLAVVAGYAHLRPELCSSVLPFPVHEETKGLLFRTRLYSAANLQALVRLGAESVSISGVERVR